MSDNDRNARFASVVVPHLADALSYARWLTGDRTDAEDVVQDACVRAFRAIETYAGGDGRAWVLTIVRNTAYTWLGKNRRTTLVPVEALDGEPDIQSEQTPEEELIARADAARLEAAIAALPTEFREALVLRDIQGLGYREIAEVIGIPLGTVMSRLARARQRLMVAVKVEEA
ncbi:MAG: sigma-70 family RNA polymerase sigma factor [Hyphomicrobiales bacterium]|nr:sigma-70 family RNA polymerase sigma factor [Hyphomicrobiales bacterium]